MCERGLKLMELKIIPYRLTVCKVKGSIVAMKKTMHILSVVIILFIMSFLAGCGNSEPVQASLSIQETSWSEQGSSTYDPRIITPLQKGDVVYDGHFVKIKVKSVNESRIVLTIEGDMVEPNDDGTINLDAKPIEKLELECGQSIELVSTSMSAGFNLVISYEQSR